MAEMEIDYQSKIRFFKVNESNSKTIFIVYIYIYQEGRINYKIKNSQHYFIPT